MTRNIRFNIPFIAGNEDEFIRDVMQRKHLAGKGYYTKKCTDLMLDRWNLSNCFLTPSCTDALEMAAILTEVGPGDEVIIPSYTFVSTANAFALRSCKIVYADSRPNHPNVDLDSIKSKITSNTKVIVVVHYGGYPADIVAIRALCDEKNILLVEDAACAIGVTINEQPIGSFGDFATFSFHETKNLGSGKGGLIVVNNEKYLKRAAVVWEKGTNRAAFFKGEVDKYGWVDLGSSFLNSEVMAAFLYAQLLKFDSVYQKRKILWQAYAQAFESTVILNPTIGKGVEYNYHMFYLLMENEQQRDSNIKELNEHGIQAVFHYQALSESSFSKHHFGVQHCSNAINHEKCLLRLPLHFNLELQDINYITKTFNELINI